MDGHSLCLVISGLAGVFAVCVVGGILRAVDVLAVRLTAALTGGEVWYRRGTFYCRGTESAVRRFLVAAESWGWRTWPLIEGNGEWVAAADLGRRNREGVS
jgi:hypothetical protein